MKKVKVPYSKPSIIKEKIRLNYFLQDSRFLDSFNPFNGLVGEVYLASGGCFLPGTQVLLQHGKTQDIEKIKHGDIVLSYNPITKLISENKVKQLFIHEKKLYEYFVINRKLYVTINHRLWVNENTWKRVDELKLNDYLLTSESEPWIIKSLEMKSKKTRVYNLEMMSEPHTYFAENIVVHNSATQNGEKTCDPWGTSCS